MAKAAPPSTAERAAADKAKAAAEKAKAAKEKAAAAQAAAQAARAKATAAVAAVSATNSTAAASTVAASKAPAAAAAAASKPPAPPASVPVAQRAGGFTVNFINGPLGMGLKDGPEGFVLVGEVQANSQAAKGGVQEGCYILDVNGQWCENFQEKDVTRLLRQGGNRSIKFSKSVAPYEA